jgi:hypothetical protein
MTEFEQAQIDAFNRMAAALEALSERPPINEDEQRLRDADVQFQLQNLERRAHPSELELEEQELAQRMNIVHRKRELMAAIHDGFLDPDDEFVKKYKLPVEPKPMDVMMRRPGDPPL